MLSDIVMRSELEARQEQQAPTNSENKAAIS